MFKENIQTNSTVQHSTPQYITVQYNTVQYSTVQYSTEDMSQFDGLQMPARDHEIPVVDSANTRNPALMISFNSNSGVNSYNYSYIDFSI